MNHYYKQSTQKIHAFEEDGSQDHLITDEMIELTSKRPSSFHSPVIENGQHTGDWDLDEAAEREASIPSSVSHRQGMLALIEFDYIDAVETFIESITDEKARRKAKAEMNASRWEFNSPRLREIWNAIGGTETQLEDLFIYADQQ